jgi:uncharacterized protein (UPF0548 family)
VFLVRRPSDAKLWQIAASVFDAPFTYDEVAAAAHPDELPEGYHRVHASRVVGPGDETFAAAVDGPVRLAITAVSPPRHPLVRLAGPMARRQQARATQGYLDALAAHVREVLA